MKEGEFDFRKSLDRTRIDLRLLRRIDGAKAGDVFQVIVEVNLLHPGGREKAREMATELVARIVKGKRKTMPKDKGIDLVKSALSSRYLFAKLTRPQIEKLVEADDKQEQEVGSDRLSENCIYKVWADEEVERLLTNSVQTVKADAAQAAFSAAGRRVVWAVIDSGIQGDHVHFQRYGNLELRPPLRHADFTLDRTEIQASVENPTVPLSDQEIFEHLAIEREQLKDPFGHGTHVAGIIAGAAGETDGREPEAESKALQDQVQSAAVRVRTEKGLGQFERRQVESIGGVAPQCRLLSLRVLDENGKGNVSNIIAAIGYIQRINDNGKWYHVHGVNLSVGYEYDAEAYGCGQSPLCVAVNRLVKSGVVVVAAAGNTGYGRIATRGMGSKSFRTSLDITINDPGNAEGAITVGATHRDKPHIYGVSYFSSRGPTADGRLKPDLVAPGERVISCAAGKRKEEVVSDIGSSCEYREDSGTSMAAPHVSGAIAAFLSIRSEFWGQSETVKEIFLNSATDLGRERYFQGHGLLDLMRAIQSV